MKNALVYYFLLSIILGTCIYTASVFQVKLPEIIRFYMNDFLIIPIVLTISLYCIRLVKNDENYQLSIVMVLYISFLYSFIFEYVLPKFHPRYTTDSIDVFLYILGGIVFYFLQKQNNK